MFNKNKRHEITWIVFASNIRNPNIDVKPEAIHAGSNKTLNLDVWIWFDCDEFKPSFWWNDWTKRKIFTSGMFVEANKLNGNVFNWIDSFISFFENLHWNLFIIKNQIIHEIEHTTIGLDLFQDDLLQKEMFGKNFSIHAYNRT